MSMLSARAVLNILLRKIEVMGPMPQEVRDTRAYFDANGWPDPLTEEAVAATLGMFSRREKGRRATA